MITILPVLRSEVEILAQNSRIYSLKSNSKCKSLILSGTHFNFGVDLTLN